ncbi:MAG TPA: GDSL-type esterase/lipase family protein, partial [Planctomycetota bacterium]|nr:GDSL-type esterase/lipase family protein [Planctomycetota bacterium]
IAGLALALLAGAGEAQQQPKKKKIVLPPDSLYNIAAKSLEGQVVDLKVRNPEKNGRAETVDGKAGKAVKFSFDEKCSGAFCMTPLRGSPEWDKAAGFSFWVKGDGSKRFGGLQFIWNEDYAARYDYMFPIDGTEWRKIVVAWRDLVPSLPSPASKFMDPRMGNAPSKISAVWFGKWWYWRDYGAHSYTVDELRLEPAIKLDENLYAPAAAPLERVLAKLKAGKPVTIVTMGDSLTDYAHWANREVNWPTLLTKKIKDKYKVDAKIVNPAIGGTQLRQGLVLMPRWLAEAPEPDLVTVCYGANDYESGMRGEMFRETVRETVDRIRRATLGKSDVLVMTTVPALEQWALKNELAEACRAAAGERKAGLSDVEKAFGAAPADQRSALFCTDKVHLGKAGHEATAAAVLEAIERAGK